MHGGNLVWKIERGFRTALVSPGGHCVFASLAQMIGTFDLELQRRERRSAKHPRVQRNVGANGLLSLSHSTTTRRGGLIASINGDWFQRLSVKTWI